MSLAKAVALLKFHGRERIDRDVIFKRDSGICASCKSISDDWEADHIIPVAYGGGNLGLRNIQTLCKACHRVKTSIQIKEMKRKEFRKKLAYAKMNFGSSSLPIDIYCRDEIYD